LIALLVLAVVGFAGWAFVTRAWDTAPAKSDVVGTWTTGNSGRRMAVYPSGKITFYNIPKGAIESQGEKVESATPVTISGKWDRFWNYGWWGGVEGYYSLPGGRDGTLMATGNGLTGYHLSLEFGESYQYSYAFHRSSQTP
jgi:hypothetical protein